MKIIAAKDYEAMSRKAANLIAAQVLVKPSCVLGLATGSTPLGIYKELIEWYKRGDLDFSAVRSANLDEYCGLSRENDQSYYYYMHENLFCHINIQQSNTHIPFGMAEDLEEECKRYDARIAELGGIDLQLLGIGHNGHIGFNEPDDAFTTGTHCVTLAAKTVEANARFFASIDQVPKKACTMGIGAIMQAKKVVLVANGSAKAPILFDAFFGPVTPKVPASVLQLHSDFTLIADEEALAVIREKNPQAL